MRLTSLIAALVVAAVVAYWFVLRHDIAPDPVTTVSQEASAAEQTAPPVPVQVFESAARDTRSILVVRGRTEANRLVRVAAQTTSRVISEPLRRGAAITAGDLLCRLDPGTRQAELAEAEAALTEAEAEAIAAESLSSKGFAAETTLKARRAALRAAQARRDSVGWDIAQLEIRAPFDGVLETDAAEIGTYLKPGDLCATVIDLGKVKVTGFVAEGEIDLLTEGQQATARLVNGIEAAGRISFLARTADSDTRTYAVEVTLENADGRLRDGMTAEIAVPLPPASGHLIPQSALTLDDEGRLGVRLATDGVARFAAVELLRDAENGVWVAGLPETARIIVVGQEFVRDGRAIEAHPTEARR